MELESGTEWRRHKVKGWVCLVHRTLEDVFLFFVFNHCLYWSCFCDGGFGLWPACWSLTLLVFLLSLFVVFCVLQVLGVYCFFRYS
ncbi:hypothetical protein VTJ04DRAFT_5494 [Mycothermus thermophilus]|uniref:uncharacterized protein n=1 Tax=Humicola insolens TaxID=85995 RepID=UPI0037429F6D